METRDLIIFGIVVLYAVVRLYMKYGRKNEGTKSSDRETKFDSSTDYEPYSGHRN